MTSGKERLAVGVGRHLIHRLRGLGEVEAPASLLGAVLAGVGPEDGYWETDSPIGRIYVAYNPAGIAAVAVAEDGEAFERLFRARHGRPVRRVASPPARLVNAVAEQLHGGKGRLEYDLRGLTEFERAVLSKALEIPRGEVRPYAWIAREIGRPAAVRAVGTALANNPVPLLIPCHRVVKSDGRMGNYAFGPEAKRVMLNAEAVGLEELERLAAAGVRFVGSNTTHVYCLPTCRHARRIAGEHRVLLPSTIAATRAGYRPCRVCRPAAAMAQDVAVR